MLHELSIRNKLIVMSAVMSALFLVALDQTIVSTALAAIVKEFNSFSSLGFIVTAYMLTTTVTVPLAGKLSDMYGRKPLLLAGVSIFTIGSLLSGLAPTVEWLIAWRALQGIGGGIITANAFTIVGDLFPPKERSKWQGLFGAVFGMSSVAGPLIGGWLTDGVSLFGMVSDWRWTFLINVPIGVIATVLIIRYCPQIKHDRTHKPDYIGALLITIALATLVLAVDNTEMLFKGLIERGVSLALVQGMLLTISVLAALSFVLIEQRAKQPILPLRFFANRTYSLIMAAASLFMGAILYLTKFNPQVFGATASQAGLMLLPMVAGSITSSITIGRLVAKTGAYKRWIVAGFGLTAVGVAVLTILQPESPYWHEAIVAVFVGLGFGAAMPILTLAVQNEFTQKDLGAATSSVQLFRGLGSTIGAAVLSGILTAGILAHVGDPHQLPYIQSLQRSPAAQQMLSGELNADVLLRLNAQKETIAKAAAQEFERLPAPAQAQAKQQFSQQQEEFTNVILHAFADGLHQVFLISSGLMVVAMIAVMPVREKRLRG